MNNQYIWDHLEWLVNKGGAGTGTLVAAVECEKVTGLQDILATLVHLRGGHLGVGHLVVMTLVLMTQSVDCCAIVATSMCPQPACPSLPVG